MPPKVAAAIVAVMAAVPKLGKGEKNTHGDYKFASIDDFLEAVRPLCAEAGLIIAQNEESFEMRDGWLVMRFSFTLAHVSGEVWAEKQTRTIMVSAKMGAQAFGAAQSYALKQFMRSLFLIATGEKGMDADEHPPADLPVVKPWTGPLNKTQLKAAVREVDRDINGCDDEASLDDVLKKAAPVIKQAKLDWPEAIDGDGQDVRGMKATAEMMRAEFKSREAMKLGGIS